jgi:DNA-3-methyladenine glycosylase II
MTHLINADPNFSELIQKYGVPDLYSGAVDENTCNFSVPTPPFHSLLETIVYQQINGASARVVFAKLLGALNVTTGEFATPEHIDTADFKVDFVDGKKKIFVNGAVSGLSECKSVYVRSLASHFLDPTKLKLLDFQLVSDEELMTKLCAVKGLGVWSVHVYMLFKLHRPDVLPVGDLNIRRGVCRLYGLPPKTFEGGGKKTIEAMRSQCAHWSPYSSLATLYMWDLAASPLPISSRTSATNTNDITLPIPSPPNSTTNISN